MSWELPPCGTHSSHFHGKLMLELYFLCFYLPLMGTAVGNKEGSQHHVSGRHAMSHQFQTTALNHQKQMEVGES